MTGKRLSTDEAAASEYIGKCADMIAAENYSPQQFYNADETDLNIKALPSKSQAAKELSGPGFKFNKERMTVYACSKAANTHKLPLMVIWKPQAYQPEPYFSSIKYLLILQMVN